jgi:hypothetical protein
VLDAGVENLVVEKGGRLGFEEDTGPLLFDHFVVFAGSETTLSCKFACAPTRSATNRRPPVSEICSEAETMSFTARTAVSVSASSAHPLPGGSGAR